MADISISQSTFAGLLIKVLTPDPDGDGRVPWRFRPQVGPKGPFPEPWDSGPFPDPWGLGRPRPEPWTPFAEDATALVNRVTILKDIAEVTKSAEHAISQIDRLVSTFVDDYCGTPWTKGPWRRPPKGLDLLVIGAVLQRASEDFSKERVGETLAAGSVRFFEIGLQRIAKEGVY